MLSRWLWRTAIALIFAVSLSFAILLYWTGYRTLPRTEGQTTLAISQAGEIRRDELGVPHIVAKSWEDAFFLQGYATAQDRFWQMESLRRKAAGELSEVVGAATFALDVESRQLRFRRMADFHARSMNAQDAAVLAAYARGVNTYLRQNAGRVAPEFTLLQYDPRPWTVADTILAGLEMHRNLTSTWKHEVGKRAMLMSPDPAKVELLFPARTGVEIQPGSNAWAISGRHTASGKPLLANDPHLGWTLPSTWHMVHIEAPGLHVAGASLPGVPGVVVGHNEQIAWGVTNLGFDVQDLYEERIDTVTGRYVFQGHLEQAALDRETIVVKGRGTQQFTQWVTRHGPVLHSEGDRHFALRWTALEPGFEYPFFDLNRAKNWDEFRAALKRFPGPGQNFVYADRDGNIGYQATGKLPVRKHKGDVPVEGWTGENEWQGTIAFDELPRSFNPEHGVLVTANQNPFPKDFAYLVHGDFAAHYRANQIANLLRSRSGWKPEELVAVQKDVYSAFSDFLARQVVAAFDRKKPSNGELGPAVAVMRGWNGQMDKDAAAPMVVTLVYQNLKTKILNRAAPGRAASYLDQMSQAVIEKLLQERPKGWFPDWDRLLLDALDDAIEDGRKSQGSDFSRWQYGLYNEVTIPNYVLSGIPVAGSWFARYVNVGPEAMSGSSSTVKQTGRTVGPSMRFVADLSDWNRSLMNVTIGESGHYLSRNYRDQWETYWAGRGLPFAFTGNGTKGKVLRVSPLAP